MKTTRLLKTLLLGSLLVSSASAITLGVALSNSEQAIEAKAGPSAGHYDACESAVAEGSLSKLWTAVKSVAQVGYHSLGYDGLLTAYYTTDIKNGKIVDPYSNTSNYTSTSQQCGSYKVEGDCYNREHSIPKSWWGGGTSNQGCDIFIVVPTDGKVNGMRSNYPFGEVGTTSYTSNNNYSKLGTSNFSGYSGKVFEPNDEWKGDFARLYFYARAKWNSVSMTSGDGSVVFAGGDNGTYGLTTYATNLFMKWHKQDPVSEWEAGRNDRCEQTQGNRNPFIDHPEYADYIWGGEPMSTTKPTAISLSGNSSVNIGSSTTLTVSTTPSDAIKTVTWSSSNTSVATVSNGVVTGVSAGSVTITATSTVASGVSGTKTITVSEPSPVTMTGVTVESASESIRVNGTAQIKASPLPSNAYPLPTYSYTSSNTSVATVSSSGLITGKGDGSATITVTANQSGATKTTTVSVNVAAQSNATISYTDLKSDSYETSDTLHTSEIGKFKFKTYYCSNFSSKMQFKSGVGYLYSTEPCNLDTIEIKGASDGTLKVFGCESAGTSGTQITGSNYVFDLSDYNYFCVKAGSSVSRCTSIDITIGGAEPEDTVELNKNSMTLTVGGTETLIATASGSVTWSSDDTSVATVNSSGKVTAVSAGYATITATCGTAAADCEVTVNPAGDYVTLNKHSLSLTEGTSETLTASASGSVSWSSSNTSVATVSNGVVTAISEGSATITATSGSASDTCSVTVSAHTFVNSIQQVYTKSSGATCTDVYGLYVGAYNNGESSMIMNGEYGIMLYKQAPNSSWVENETYLKVGSSTLSIYKNLYELGSVSNVTKVTDATEISNNIAPVVTYNVTGSESTSDLTIANRLAMVTGKVSSGSVTVGADSTITMTVNSKSVQVFVKKATATQDVKDFFDAAGTTNTISIQGFTGFYNTNFQVQFKKAVKEESSYTAENFAQDLLDLTNTACSYSSSHNWVSVKTELSGTWITLEGADYYAKLPAAQKTILVNTVSSETGTTLQRAMNRYDHIVARYDLNNFITGRTKLSMSPFKVIENAETIIPLIVIVSLVSVSTIAGVLFLRKKKYE